MRRIAANRRKKNLPLILNKAEAKNNTLPISADNLPIGMTEDYSSTESSNLGTDRPLQGGKCIVGNGSFRSESATAPSYNTSDTLTLKINLFIPTSALGVAYFILVKADGTGTANTDFRLYYTTTGGNTLLFESRNPIAGTLNSVSIDLAANNLIDKWLNVEIVFGQGLIPKMVVNGIVEMGINLNEEGVNNSSSRKLRIGNTSLSLRGKMYGIEFLVNGVPQLNYKLSSESPTTLFNSIGGVNNSTIINYYSGLWSAQNDYSYLDEEGFSEGIGANLGVFIPKDASITLPPFKDILGDNLQYISRAPSRVNFVDSPAFLGDGSASFSISGLLTTDTFIVPTGSNTPTCTTNGILTIANNDIVFDFIVQRGGVDWARFVVTYISNPANYTLFNVLEISSAKNGILVNGATANRTEITREDGDYLQLGIYNNGVQDVPIVADLTSFADGTALSSGIVQDGKTFLDTGTKIQLIKTPRVVQAEQINRFYTDANDDVIDVEFDDFTGVILDQDFSDVSETDKVSNIRKHHKALTGRQLITEKVITNN